MSSDRIQPAKPRPGSKLGARPVFQLKPDESLATCLGLGLHDLGNLLQIVLAAAEEGQESDASPERTREALDICQSAAKRAGSLLSVLVDQEAGRDASRPDRSGMSACQVIEDAVKLIRPTVPRSFRLTLEMESEAAVVELDPCLLHRAMINLLHNAVRAARPAGEVVVSVHLGDRDMPRIVVTDNGIGMRPEVLEQAADPGFSSKTKRHGYGLAFVREFALSCGGSLGLESQPGQGTRVVLSFPGALNHVERSPA